MFTLELVRSNLLKSKPNSPVVMCASGGVGGLSSQSEEGGF